MKCGKAGSSGRMTFLKTDHVARFFVRTFAAGDVLDENRAKLVRDMADDCDALVAERSYAGITILIPLLKERLERAEADVTRLQKASGTIFIKAESTDPLKMAEAAARAFIEAVEKGRRP